MHGKTILSFCICAYFFSGTLLAQPAGTLLPVDKKATLQTINLYNNLKALLQQGIMFGHQDDLAYGVGWKYEQGRSDVKDVTGDYPAVQGYEIGHLELDSLTNLDSVPFQKIKSFIQNTYASGGVVTISWHLRNPLTGKTAWDSEKGTVASILPGGLKHDVYKSWLDKVALFMMDLKSSNGEYIPVIFRPFHELNGAWFWWGKAHCTPEEYKALYCFTVAYLRDAKNIHHLLYAFNTDRFASKEEYGERYPGNEWVDVVGFDIYQRDTGAKANEQFVKDLGGMLTLIESIAKENDKIPALTEFGHGNLPDSTWFSSVLWKALAFHKVSYALAWRNAGYKPASNSYEFYVPYSGHRSAPDFVRFYTRERTLFLKDIAGQNLYRQKSSRMQEKIDLKRH